jgi:hypothetical protein
LSILPPLDLFSRSGSCPSKTQRGIPRRRDCGEMEPALNKNAALRSPEGVALGRGEGLRERAISLKCPSRSGGCWLGAFPRGRSVTRPVASRVTLYRKAQFAHSQKNSVPADLASRAYRSPALRTLNSSWQASLTQLLTIGVHLRARFYEGGAGQICDRNHTCWEYFAEPPPVKTQTHPAANLDVTARHAVARQTQLELKWA